MSIDKEGLRLALNEYTGRNIGKKREPEEWMRNAIEAYEDAKSAEQPDDNREAFEAWCIDVFADVAPPLKKDGNGSYIMNYMNEWLRVWRASTARASKRESGGEIVKCKHGTPSHQECAWCGIKIRDSKVMPK